MAIGPAVVRTESQLARFNTARALFEKLGVEDLKKKETGKVITVEKSHSGRSSRVGSKSSRHSHYSSRSPSPLAGTERHQSAPGIRSGRSPSPSRNNAPVSDRSRGSSVDALRPTRTERKPTNGHGPANEQPKMETKASHTRTAGQDGQGSNLFLSARQRVQHLIFFHYFLLQWDPVG